MVTSLGIERAQKLSQKLQLALTNHPKVCSQQGKHLDMHKALLPSALQDEIIEKKRMRRSRAPSPEDYLLNSPNVDPSSSGQLAYDP
ncbi:hypothetical protein N7490_006294 [Penicillium lividum]|nr:hypothetical protein N7490_006294 [Penicillium lividum]